jgi:hypothetical protein
MFFLRRRRQDKPDSTSPYPIQAAGDSIPAQPAPARAVIVATKAKHTRDAPVDAETCKPPGTYSTGTLHRTAHA